MRWPYTLTPCASVSCSHALPACADSESTMLWSGGALVSEAERTQSLGLLERCETDSRHGDRRRGERARVTPYAATAAARCADAVAAAAAARAVLALAVLPPVQAAARAAAGHPLRAAAGAGWQLATEYCRPRPPG